MATTHPLEGKRILLIMNPVSGTRSKAGLEAAIAGRLRGEHVTLDSVETQRPGHGYELASAACDEGYDIVLAAGGDGTVNEIGAAMRDREAVLGIIPCGSGNGLGRTLGIPQEPDRAIDIIIEGNVVACDYGMVNSTPFFCTCGVGFDAAVAERFATMQRRGYMSYLRSTFQQYINYKPEAYALSINGKIITDRALLIAVCNVPQYGNNAYVAPDATVTDGLLDITLIHAGSPLQTILAGVELFTGTIGQNRSVEMFRAERAEISRLVEGPVQIDGEPAHFGQYLDVKCVRGGLKVFARPIVTQFRPFITPLQSFFADLQSNFRYITSKKKT